MVHIRDFLGRSGPHTVVLDLCNVCVCLCLCVQVNKHDRKMPCPRSPPTPSYNNPQRYYNAFFHEMLRTRIYANIFLSHLI